MKVDGDVSQETSVEILNPKRKVIRVESEETQDYVWEDSGNQPERSRGNVLRAKCTWSRGPTYRCDNRCSEKAVRCWQIASMVGEEGRGAHTINLCQQCYNEKLAQQGKQPLKLWQRRGVVEKKAHRGRTWKVMGNEQFIGGMWEFFTLERAGASQIKCGYGLCSPNETSWLLRYEEW